MPRRPLENKTLEEVQVIATTTPQMWYDPHLNTQNRIHYLIDSLSAISAFNKAEGTVLENTAKLRLMLVSLAAVLLMWAEALQIKLACTCVNASRIGEVRKEMVAGDKPCPYHKVNK